MLGDDQVKLSERSADELLALAVPSTMVITREQLLAVVDDLLLVSKKLYAIKLVRNLTSFGLLAAKTIVDIREEKQRIQKERLQSQFWTPPTYKEDPVHGDQDQHVRNRSKDIDQPF